LDLLLPFIIIINYNLLFNLDFIGLYYNKWEEIHINSHQIIKINKNLTNNNPINNSLNNKVLINKIHINNKILNSHPLKQVNFNPKNNTPLGIMVAGTNNNLPMMLTDYDFPVELFALIV